jgi:CCR4-NOT transcription complex subunit 1
VNCLQELHITAVFFGQLIARGLLSSISLGLALRYVLESLRKPPQSKMFLFGLDAIRQFASVARQWPQFLLQVGPTTGVVVLTYILLLS